jgi:hypothetical protein
VGIQKRGGDGGHMGWSEVRDKVVDGVGNGTLAGSFYIGEGSHITGVGVGGIGAAGGGASADTGATGGEAGGGCKKKNEGPGS